MEPLPKGANFVRAKMLWEIGLEIAGNPLTPYGGDRDMCITVGSGSGSAFRPLLRMATGSAILAEEVAKGGIEMAFVNPSALLTQAVRGVGLFTKPLPLKVIAVYPSWDRFVMAVHPRTGIHSIAELKAKRYPLKLSIREDPTHSTIVLIEQIFALHGLTVADIEAWGGHLQKVGGPGDSRRLRALAAGEIDAVFDEGIGPWLRPALEAGLRPIDPEESEFERLIPLGWRRVVLPAQRWPLLGRDHWAIDFSGWPIYAAASLPDKLAYDACSAIAAREAEMPWTSGDYEGLAQLGSDTPATSLDVPLHPGAQRWYREHGAK